MKQDQRPCSPAVIAEDVVGSVSVCPGCGAVHVSLQHVTLRLAPDAFRVVACMLGTAQERIDRAIRNGPAPDAAGGPIEEDRLRGLNLH